MIQLFKLIIKQIGFIAPLLDILFFPLIILSSAWLRIIKYIGLKNFFFTKRVFNTLGVFPIVKHYYEPQFNFSSYQQEYRKLPAIDFNDSIQTELLKSFQYQDELLKKPIENVPIPTFYYNNGSFPSGDAECYYSLIRKFKPKRIIEIGSGYSTLIAHEAIIENYRENKSKTLLTCIEPYEMPWLSKIDVNLIRKKVEDIELDFFKQLNDGDVLFIDSSHVIRPQGDVLYEVLQILPHLNSGVMVHFHDIFTPLNYPEDWLKKEYRLWNEQYLIEAFLSYNKEFEITIAMSYLAHNYKEHLYKIFPVLKKTPGRIPGSLWLRKK